MATAVAKPPGQDTTMGAPAAGAGGAGSTTPTSASTTTFVQGKLMPLTFKDAIPAPEVPTDSKLKDPSMTFTQISKDYLDTLRKAANLGLTLEGRWSWLREETQREAGLLPRLAAISCEVAILEVNTLPDVEELVKYGKTLRQQEANHLVCLQIANSIVKYMDEFFAMNTGGGTGEDAHKEYLKGRDEILPLMRGLQTVLQTTQDHLVARRPDYIKHTGDWMRAKGASPLTSGLTGMTYADMFAPSGK
ncbi:MAG: hypothetical protein MRY21_01345 [Simkaniaceae bacterium]|nr:hypothetical protein [Simkaniaceae bacterium]